MEHIEKKTEEESFHRDKFASNKGKELRPMQANFCKYLEGNFLNINSTH